MKKSIFSSLGSNYSLRQVALHALQLLFPDHEATKRLRMRLAAMFSVPDCVLVYKGRDAIEFALRSYGISTGDVVLTQAFACFAVEEGIRRSGALPLYVDLGRENSNLTLATVRKAYEKSNKKKVKALLVQHMLGVPADSTMLRQWCTQNDIVYIEDLAQAFGGVDDHGDLLGLHADAVVLSFGRDKVLDAVSGGAVLLRKKPVVNSVVAAIVPWHVVVRELLYPAITAVIRLGHSFGLGGVLHFVAKKLQLVWSPTKTVMPMMAKFPKEYAALAEDQLLALDLQLQHRREVAHNYHTVFVLAKSEKALELGLLTDDSVILHGNNLRYAISVPDPAVVIEALALQKVYIGDRWYRAPVDGGAVGCETVYVAGSCREAENRAATILTLPTHYGVSVGQARTIAHAICAVIQTEMGKK